MKLWGKMDPASTIKLSAVQGLKELVKIVSILRHVFFIYVDTSCTLKFIRKLKK